MIAAALPLKRLDEAKSRLAAQLSPPQRRDLVLSLLADTVAALRASGVVDRIALVGAEGPLARELSLDWVPEAGGLNPSLRSAASWASHLGASGLLIVPSDLPFISGQAVRALIQAAIAPGIAIAPTRDGGTGALLLQPPDVLEPAFGPDSFARHVALAAAQGVPVCRVEDAAFAFDLDTPEDLAALRAAQVKHRAEAGA